MNIGMIAVMVIGMVVLNGCGVDRTGCNNSVRVVYPGKQVYEIYPYHYIVIDSGKVISVTTMNLTNTNITDSTTYFVPSKCQ